MLHKAQESWLDNTKLNEITVTIRIISFSFHVNLSQLQDRGSSDNF